MAICQFFLRGACKFGSNCKNVHAAYDDNYSNRGSPILRPAQNQPQQHTDDKTITESVINDMLELEKGHQWLFSSYTPFKDKPLFPGFEDKSFEELRFQYYTAQKDGTVDLYKQQLNALVQETILNVRALQNPSAEVIKALRSFYFGNSSFNAQQPQQLASPLLLGQQNQQSVFQKPSQQQSIFQTQPQQSIFQTQQQSIFQTQPQKQAQSIFQMQQQPQQSIFPVQPQQQQSMFQTQAPQQQASIFQTQQQQPSIFQTQPQQQQQQQSIFQTQQPPAFPAQQPTAFPAQQPPAFLAQQPPAFPTQQPQQSSIFQTQQNIFQSQQYEQKQMQFDDKMYSNVEQLSEEDKQAYESGQFTFGCIPEKPPALIHIKRC